MLIIKPDFARRIDLPGPGPCPRPVDIDQSKTGFEQLVSLRVYSFAQAMVIDGEAEGDEVFIVLMRGAATVAVDQGGSRVGTFPLSTDGGSRAVYLPPHASYQLTATADCDIAYARVLPPTPEVRAPKDFAPADSQLAITGYAGGMDLTLSALSGDTHLALFKRVGGASERFLHVRTNDGGRATLLGEQLDDWDSVALNGDERPTLRIEKGAVDVLTITASAH